MRYRLRTLLILLAVLPPLLWFGWTKYEEWRAEQARRAAIEELERELERQAEADQVITQITIDEAIIDQARLIEFSSPPKTPLKPLRPEEIDLDKLMRPVRPAKSGE
jgi:hypothetical protein